jgi:hypothetical protein
MGSELFQHIEKRLLGVWSFCSGLGESNQRLGLRMRFARDQYLLSQTWEWCGAEALQKGEVPCLVLLILFRGLGGCVDPCTRKI